MSSPPRGTERSAGRSGEHRRIATAATVILLAYALSRVLGYVRAVVIARTFGTSHDLDLYFVAFRVPDLLFNLLLAGAISSAFIPVLSEHLARGEGERARQVAQRVLNLSVLILTAGALVLFALAPLFVQLTAFGYSAGDQARIVELTRILLLQPIFLGAGGMVIGVLTAHQRFFAQALAPLCYNGAIIVAAGVFAPHSGVGALAWGVVVGAVLHLGIQVPSLWRTGWRPARSLGLGDEGVRKVGRLMLPISLGLAAAQVNFFADTTLATQLPHGRLAALNYADTVAQVPLGTFSQALAFVLFPFLARDAALGALDRIRRRTALAVRLNIFTLVPASVGLAVLSLPIVVLLFQHGRFTPGSSLQTALPLIFFSLGITGQAVTALMVRVFYALQDVMTPLRISATVVVFNLLTNVILVHTVLAQAGLALGTSIAALLNAGFLSARLRRRLSGLEGRQVSGSVVRAGAGALLMGALLFAIARWTGLYEMAFGARQALLVLGLVALGAVVYAAIEAGLRSPELGVLVDALRRRRSASRLAE